MEKEKQNYSDEGTLVIFIIFLLVVFGLLMAGFYMGKTFSYTQDELDLFCQELNYDFGEKYHKHVECFNMNETKQIHEDYFYKWKGGKE